MKSVKIPSYIKIKEEIVEMIEDGRLKVGEKLPSETEMAKRFNVSRETFRSTLRLLQDEGRIIVKHGIGTFVVNSLPKIPNSLEKLSSITAMIKSAGLTEGEQREAIGVEESTKEWADVLQIVSGAPVVVHERIRTANEEPVVFSINIIPKVIVGSAILERESIGSLFDYLERECNIEIPKADTELVVPLHTDRNSQRLLIRPETTVLLMKQLHYDQTNTPVMYSLDYFRNDIFSFWIRRVKE